MGAAILAITKSAIENGTEEFDRLQRYHSVHPLYSNKQYFMTSHIRIENKWNMKPSVDMYHIVNQYNLNKKYTR